MIDAMTLGVIVNDADPLSVQIGAYYESRRHVPPANVVHVRFGPGSAALSREEFARIARDVDQHMPRGVQAYALTWAKPYRVDCFSITYAFSTDIDGMTCATGCSATRLSPYFNSGSSRPYDDLHFRPTMTIAATTFDAAKRLIDRGVASDGSAPKGTGYLLKTSDPRRSVRAWEFPDAKMLVGDRLRLEIVDADAIVQKPDVMFYFTGLARVGGIETNRFLPGAVADHLTSLGGQLTDSFQMSSLRWLEAGATGSYGAVVEPCNVTAKFPNVGLMMKHYLAGETLIEAYWKSVAMPAQGIFIGEPLARPWSGSPR